jgi:hypothetical protein
MVAIASADLTLEKHEMTHEETGSEIKLDESVPKAADGPLATEINERLEKHVVRKVSFILYHLVNGGSQLTEI